MQATDPINDHLHVALAKAETRYEQERTWRSDVEQRLAETEDRILSEQCRYGLWGFVCGVCTSFGFVIAYTLFI